MQELDSQRVERAYFRGISYYYFTQYCGVVLLHTILLVKVTSR